MANYCDSNQLEKDWHYWLLADATPRLEAYRLLGLLWTKMLAEVRDRDGNLVVGQSGSTHPDPLYPVRTHCLALATPFFFQSVGGIPDDSAIRWGLDSLDHAVTQLPDSELNLLSTSPLHRLEKEPFYQHDYVVPVLLAEGYVQEKPTKESWHAMLRSISLICSGISTRINLQSEEEQQDLASEAMLQVTQKLSVKKLVYTPGRAPVFNLLTTTIYRCIFSTLNKNTKTKRAAYKLMEDLRLGAIPTATRSLRLHTGEPIKPRR